MDIKTMFSEGGLRKRWLLNTASVVIALGLVCVLAVTASFSSYSIVIICDHRVLC